jgi:putative flippase GtrA
MKSLVRWVKFNLVGAIGMGVQLGALAVLNRALPGHYLWATAMAIELALLHNFAWHQQFTWRDRRDQSTASAQLLRFHLSNGLVSLVGNLVLMRLLVQEARQPVIMSNTIAILCCSIVNFYAGERWAFAERREWKRAGVQSSRLQ